MVRPAQQLHEWREPAPLRPAATILLLRDAAPGIEVLMTRRSLTASFAPDTKITRAHYAVLAGRMFDYYYN